MAWKQLEDFFGGGYHESGTAFSIVFGRGKTIRLDATAAAIATLPDATKIPNWALGGPIWSITNASSSFDITIKDDGGNTLATLTANPTGSEYDSVNVYLESNTTSDGIWHFKTGQAGQIPAPPIDEKFFLLAGKTPVALDGDICQEYDLEADSWTDKAEASGNCFGCACGQSGDKGYSARGTGVSDKATRSYDPGFNLWADLTDMTIGAQDPISGDVLSAKLYAMGVADTGISDGTEEYSVSGDSWDTKADATERTKGAATIRYVVGSELVVYSSDINFERDTVQDYTPGTDTWFTRPDMPFPGRAYPGVATNPTNTDAWLITGFGDVEGGAVAIDDVDKHELATDTWTEQTDYRDGDASHLIADLAASRMFAGLGNPGNTEFNEFLYQVNSWIEKEDPNRQITSSRDHGLGINAG